jgi:hypothetical protein
VRLQEKLRSIEDEDGHLRCLKMFNHPLSDVIYSALKAFFLLVGCNVFLSHIAFSVCHLPFIYIAVTSVLVHNHRWQEIAVYCT